MTENIFIGIFRLKGHQGMGKTCACFKFKEKVWLWDALLGKLKLYLHCSLGGKVVNQELQG